MNRHATPILAALLALTFLLPPRPAQAHMYDLHGSSPYRFGVPMYIARQMRIGVSQPIYQCWVERIVHWRADIIVFSRSELEPASDAAWQETVRKLNAVDLFIVTENPKQEFVETLLEKADMMYQKPLIYADLGLPPLHSEFEDPYPSRTPPLPYFSINTSSQLMYAILNACARMDPSNNLEFRRNWQDAMTAFEIMKRKALEEGPEWRNVDVRCATLRGGQEYLIEEAGMVISGVVPPLPDGPVTAAYLPELVASLQRIKAEVLVCAETLDPAIRESIERDAGVLVCELLPIGEVCGELRQFDHDIEINFRKLLEVKAAVWERTDKAAS